MKRTKVYVLTICGEVYGVFRSIEVAHAFYDEALDEHDAEDLYISTQYIMD